MIRYERGRGGVNTRDFRLSATADAWAVRALLGDLCRRLRALGVEDALCGSVELALAEAMNNIVEHAYGPDHDGTGVVRLRVRVWPDRVCAHLRDTGAPLPVSVSAVTPRPDPARPVADLPEGGFGWWLIRDMSSAVRYRRGRDGNHLWIAFSRQSGG